MALNNVPLSGQSLDDTRVPINQNFSVISTAFAIDHVVYNTSGQGKHNKVTFPVQTGAPTFASGDDGLYSLAFNNQVTTRNELFVHGQKFGGAVDTPFTASILSQQAPANDTSGWSYLPSGILLRWSQVTGAAGTRTVTLDNTFPGFSNIFWVGLTPVSATAAYSLSLINIISNTQFRVFISGSSSQTFNYLVIGR